MGPGDPGCKNSRFALFRRFGPFWTRLSLQEIVNHGQKNKIDYFCSRDGLETWWNSPPNQWNTKPNRLFLHPGCNRLFFRAEICRLTNLIDYCCIQHQRPKDRDDSWRLIDWLRTLPSSPCSLKAEKKAQALLWGLRCSRTPSKGKNTEILENKNKWISNGMDNPDKWKNRFLNGKSDFEIGNPI